MLRQPRPLKIARLATAIVVTAVALGATWGDGVARASYMADPSLASPTTRHVRVSLVRDPQPDAQQVVRLDLDEPRHVDALPLAPTTASPQRSVRVDLAEPEDAPVAVLAPSPRRVVRLSLDGAADASVAPRVFHADLDAAETFTPSTMSGGLGPVRLVRSEL